VEEGEEEEEGVEKKMRMGAMPSRRRQRTQWLLRWRLIR